MDSRLFVAFFVLVLSSCADLIFQDDFDQLDLRIWEHEITAAGGGNWEFEWYANNRSNSYVSNGILYIQPTLTADTIGESNLNNPAYALSLWGLTPASQCTGNAYFGCQRNGNGGGNVINPIQSVAMRTTRSMAMKYGRLEVSARLPAGDWLWPAIWMMPTYEQYGGWPASGEIDIVESRGNMPPYAAGGCNSFGSTLHFGPFPGQDPFMLTHAEYTLPTGTFNDEFHVFGLYWDDRVLYTYVDDDANRVLVVNMSSQSFWQRGGWGETYNNPWQSRPGNNAPFDQEFYLIFNVAVGGTAGYFPDGVGDKPWSDSDPNAVNAFWNAQNQWYPSWKGNSSALAIDWVRVWDLSDDDNDDDAQPAEQSGVGFGFGSGAASRPRDIDDWRARAQTNNGQKATANNRRNRRV